MYMYIMHNSYMYTMCVYIDIDMSALHRFLKLV